MNSNGKRRVIIEAVTPCVDNGEFSVKRIVGDQVVVEADLFTDGHDEVCGVVAYRDSHSSQWQEVPLTSLGNDRWQASFTITQHCPYYYTVYGWVDHFGTWQHALRKKHAAAQDIGVDLQIGAQQIRQAMQRTPEPDKTRLKYFADAVTENSTSCSRSVEIALCEELTILMKKHADRANASSLQTPIAVWVDREKARFSTWYEIFPRSCDGAAHGTFKDCQKHLPRIARMGFDVLYFPPIHPVGRKHRKGKNNSVISNPGDPGSPWAIGSSQGGHKAVNPDLGTIEDFQELLHKAKEYHIEIALDIAFQCSPDHPYIQQHPQWFQRRPDGTIQYAENPPKKYEDIVPFDFENPLWQSLWEELKSVIEFWIDKGVSIFRVDNPHTKPFPFWKWLIEEVRKQHPHIIFLSEAFTRPKVMQRLAKIGFSQSYTYFTWRNTKQEIVDYVRELVRPPLKDYFRPNFWPNTPDILSEFLQFGGRPAFVLRLALAATLSSNYGIYGPAYELCIAEALAEKEEYAHSEKYEIKQWDWNREDSLCDLIQRINEVRRENPALQYTDNVSFYPIDNEYLLFYGKTSPDNTNVIFVVITVDPFHKQTGWVEFPCDVLGLKEGQPYLMHDCISNEKYIWQGKRNYVEINPHVLPMHIFRIHRRLRRENDFDYYM